MINGIDVSHWQGKIDWDLVKQDPKKIEFAIIKCTEGVNGIDKMCRYNADHANRVGIKVGYYHFATLNDHDEVKDATAEADWFLKTVSTMPKHELALVLDIEVNKAELSDEEVLNWIKTFCNRIQAAGKATGIYSYGPFLNANLPGTHGLGQIPLYLAAYIKGSQPKLPYGWDKYKVWQYSCNGKVMGIEGRVDLDKMVE